jgi:hypothetical protein
MVQAQKAVIFVCMYVCMYIHDCCIRLYLWGYNPQDFRLGSIVRQQVMRHERRLESSPLQYRTVSSSQLFPIKALADIQGRSGQTRLEAMHRDETLWSYASLGLVVVAVTIAEATLVESDRRLLQLSTKPLHRIRNLRKSACCLGWILTQNSWKGSLQILGWPVLITCHEALPTSPTHLHNLIVPHD